jgi:hypothetical protein
MKKNKIAKVDDFKREMAIGETLVLDLIEHIPLRIKILCKSYKTPCNIKFKYSDKNLYL